MARSAPVWIALVAIAALALFAVSASWAKAAEGRLTLTENGVVLIDANRLDAAVGLASWAAPDGLGCAVTVVISAETSEVRPAERTAVVLSYQGFSAPGVAYASPDRLDLEMSIVRPGALRRESRRIALDRARGRTVGAVRRLELSFADGAPAPERLGLAELAFDARSVDAVLRAEAPVDIRLSLSAPAQILDARLTGRAGPQRFCPTADG